MGPFVFFFFFFFLSIFICLSAYWGFGSAYCLPFFLWSPTWVLVLYIGFPFLWSLCWFWFCLLYSLFQ
jgi:hypothetical protein